MNRVLLLGAGFSRNWGGWLGDEVFEYLIGHPSVIQNSYIKNILWKHKEKRSGFENALAEVQIDFRNQGTSESKHNMDDFQNAIMQMFYDMNAGFKGYAGFEINIQHFLTLFDAIFTLNQDLLIEGHYSCNNGVAASPFATTTQLIMQPQARWNFWQTPGVSHPKVNPDAAPHPNQIYENWRVAHDETSFVIKERKQP